MIPLRIEENNLKDLESILLKIPEFEHLPTMGDIHSRIYGVRHLVLTAHDHFLVVGFKIGYERDGRFYSWLGGVVPPYRQQGVASLLADRQEQWAKEQGYPSIWMKTRNCFPEMLIMAIRRGFRITGFDPRDKIEEHRIVLEKSI
jgi:GNAT superfamily N-acetyltransferase